MRRSTSSRPLVGYILTKVRKVPKDFRRFVSWLGLFENDVQNRIHVQKGVLLIFGDVILYTPTPYIDRTS